MFVNNLVSCLAWLRANLSSYISMWLRCGMCGKDVIRRGQEPISVVKGTVAGDFLATVFFMDLLFMGLRFRG
jgi:hypothetical protein